MSRESLESESLPVVKIGEAAGVGWYSPALFRALRKAGEPLAPGCADWDAWFDVYQAAFVRLKNDGLRPHKIAIDPGDLARWLASCERDHSIAAHWDYVAWRLGRQLDQETSR